MSTNHIKVPEGAISERGFVLLNRYGNPACTQDAEQTFRGETVVLLRGSAPRHAGSEGHVEVTHNGHERRYYPSVFAAQWVRTSDWQAGIYAPRVSDYTPGSYA